MLAKSMWSEGCANIKKDGSLLSFFTNAVQVFMVSYGVRLRWFNPFSNPSATWLDTVTLTTALPHSPRPREAAGTLHMKPALSSYLFCRDFDDSWFFDII